MVPILRDAFDRKRAAGDINRRTQSSHKLVECRMLQRQFNCPEAAHRNTDNRPSRGICKKPGFHVCNQVLRYIALEAVFRAVNRIRVLGRLSFGHYQYQLSFRKRRHVGVITPFAEICAGSMKQVNNGEAFPTWKNLGKNDSVCDLAFKRSTPKCNVLHCDTGSEPWVVWYWG
jgi:hypothetical protein